mmetsp:Transcript_5786/g.14819  ORF Transcript_5786/g.14819 Transcript_5786/m.14819 type:complete len:233 (+) Transcript_5786:154-852(+)
MASTVGESTGAIDLPARRRATTSAASTSSSGAKHASRMAASVAGFSRSMDTAHDGEWSLSKSTARTPSKKSEAMLSCESVKRCARAYSVARHSRSEDPSQRLRSSSVPTSAVGERVRSVASTSDAQAESASAPSASSTAHTDDASPKQRSIADACSTTLAAGVTARGVPDVPGSGGLAPPAMSSRHAATALASEHDARTSSSFSTSVAGMKCVAKPSLHASRAPIRAPVSAR